MFFKVSILTIFIVMISSVSAIDSSYRGKNWNTVFYESCGFPSSSEKRPSVRWLDPLDKNDLVFSLYPKDVGKCLSDDVSRHNAPYWERAEVKQEGHLSSNKNYKIKFDIQFLEGFKSERETFFQIHAYSSGCPSSPILMMKSNFGKLGIDVLENVTKKAPSGNHKNRFAGDIDLTKVGRYMTFEILLNQKSKNMTIKLDNKILLDREAYEIQHCGKAYVKLGTYRPGNEKSKLSVSSYRNVTISQTKLD